eukprot:5035649-Amphidinium_carterae.1
MQDPAFAARVGSTQEQVQVSRDRGLLQPVGQTTDAVRQTAEAGRSSSTVAGASAVSGTAGMASAIGADSGGTTSGSVPGAASGPAPETERSSTTRGAEDLDEEDQEAHKFIKLDDVEEIATLYGTERISVVGEVTKVKVAVPMEKNELEYKQISSSDYHDLVDEDTGEALDAQKVAEG